MTHASSRPLAAVAASWILPGNFSWDDLLAGRSAVVRLSEAFPVPMGAPVTDPGPPPPHAYPHLPRAVHLAHTVLHRLPLEPGRPYGLVLSLPNLYSEPEYLETALAEGDRPEAMDTLGPYSFHTPLNFLADGLHAAPRLRIDSACAGGNDALITAAQWLARGVVDDVLVVGTSAMLNPVALALFHNLKALNDQPDPEASCPFDARRRGFVMGEAAAAVWLTRRNVDRPLGYLVGYGQSMSAGHFVDPPPSPETWLTAARGALGSLPLEELAYVSAHGTATRAGDAAETRLLHQLLGPFAPRIPISSVKSMLGHSLGAAALVEAVVCWYALRAGTAPPTANLRVPDPACDLNYLPGGAGRLQGSHALSNAFGFGGHNACVLLRGAP